MTDHQPDDLFDALRDRLADYGQEPPAPLWANIRAQLPPPVAAPQLRQRARRLAALALLLLVMSVGIWQWWRPGSQSIDRPATQITRTQAAPTASPPAGLTAAAGHPATATAPDNTVRQASADALARAAGAASGADDDDLSRKPAAANAGMVIASSRRSPAAATFIASSRSRALATARATRHGRGIEVRAASKARVDALASERSTTSALAVVRPIITARDQPSRAAQFPARGRENAARAASRLAVPDTDEQQPAEMLAEPLARTTQKTPLLATMPARTAWQSGVPRVAESLPPPFPASAQLARADSLPPLPVAKVRRWALQALAGPALTARTLGAGQLAYAPTPTNTYSPNNNLTRSAVNNISAENERPATGFGAEVQLQRQLNGRWSLGTGLGYHTFATDQTVNVHVVYSSPTASNLPPDSLGTLRVRDTYHFLTLPLRVGYQLGAGPARLRYGLRAGAEVAFYLGGQSTEGGTYGGNSRSWDASGSPYRPFSLALSLGAEVRYQLAPGWELLAQPTLTHFVTSVARPSSGYVPRYPLAATALVGVAYWLR